MNFYLIGIDYKTVADDVRELAYAGRKEIELFVRSVSWGQASVLFTCSRVELYGISRDGRESLNIFLKIKKAFPDVFSGAYFKNENLETSRHAFRLACGLESLVPFERQILEQLSLWIEQENFPERLYELWSKVLRESVFVRADSGIDTVQKDIADLLIDDIRTRIGSLRGKKILVVGTGKVADIVSRKAWQGAVLYFAARRKNARAQDLARRAKAGLIPFDGLSQHLKNADAVITATSSPHYVLEPAGLHRFLQERERILYIYDLAFPRDVHPQVRRLPGVEVLDMKSLAELLNGRRAGLKKYFEKAESLIQGILREQIGVGYVEKHQNRYQAEPALI